MKKIFAFFALSMLLLANTSCLNDDGNQENKQSFVASCYNSINTNGEYKITAANYSVEFDFVANTVSVTTSDTEISASTYKISNLPLKMSSDKGYYFYAAAPVVTNTAGAELPALKITDFYGQYTGITLKFSYVVNGTTRVYASYVEDTYAKHSTTTVTPLRGGDPFVWDQASYKFALSTGKTDAKSFSATMVVDNVKFSDKMPITLSDMTVEGLTVSADARGMVYSAESVIPKLQGVEQPDYTLSDIEVVVRPSFSPVDYFIHERANISFKCMGFQVEAEAYIYTQQ
ncbi:MAG: hypothetical protein ACI4UN_04195 [Muribaculaceae bacterium]